MRLKLVTALMMAGAVVGCASNPPPPPPVAMAPEPPPPPPMVAPMAGLYTGMAELAADAPAKCHKMTAKQSARVRNGMITLGAMRGKLGPDGSIMMAPHGGMTMTGTVNGNMADITTMSRGCGYHYSLTHA